MSCNWQTSLLGSLVDEPLAIRDHISDFLAIKAVDSLLCKALPWPKNALIKLSLELKPYINTRDKLVCFELCMAHVYQQQQALQTNIQQPNRIIMMPKATAAVSDDNLPLHIIDKILILLYQPETLPPYPMDKQTYQQQLGRWLLLCAFECNLTRISELAALVKTAPDDWQRYPDSAAITVMLKEPHRRVWLQPASCLLYKHLLASNHHDGTEQTEKSVKQAINAYSKYALSTIGKLATLNVARLITDLGLFHQPVGLRHFWQYEQALPDKVIERLFTLNNPLIAANKKEKQGKLLNSIPISNGHNDALVRRKVTTYLNQYHITNPTELRNHRSFGQCLLHLKSCLSEPISVGLYLTISWIIELFEDGSLWKEKLASSTLETYFSAITQFQLNGYNDEDIQHYSSEKLSDLCQSALYTFEDAPRQYTVLRFLQFMQRCPTIPKLEIEELSLLSPQGVIRTNYLLPTEFDAICQSFVLGKGVYEQRITLFMRLCYYLGLRESEALALTLGDIDFETGLLSITHNVLRKTPAAVRNIPLCLLPAEHLDVLAFYHARRKAVDNHNEPLFTDWYYENLEVQFITHLRTATNDETWVTHLLRHCFANNQLLLLALMTKQIARLPEHFAHALFSVSHQETLCQHFKLIGRKINLHFPILDWISQIVGHAGPATTATVYLHLLDWVIAQKFKTPYLISKLQLQQWISPNSNYVFEVLKKISHTQSESSKLVKIDNADALNWIASNSKTLGYSFSVIDKVPQDTTQIKGDNRLVFSAFYDELSHAMQGVDDLFIHPSIKTFISTNAEIHTLPSLKAKDFPQWIRFCQYLEGAIPLFNSIDSNGLALLAEKIKQGENIQGIRELTIYLHGLRALNLSGCKIQVTGNNKKRLAEWQEKITQSGHTMVFKQSGQQRLSATLKPFSLSWRLWPSLNEIMDLYFIYECYRSFFGEVK